MWCVTVGGEGCTGDSEHQRPQHRSGTVPITAATQQNGKDFVTGSKSFSGGSSGVITLQVSRVCEDGGWGAHQVTLSINILNTGVGLFL